EPANRIAAAATARPSFFIKDSLFPSSRRPTTGGACQATRPLKLGSDQTLVRRSLTRSEATGASIEAPATTINFFGVPLRRRFAKEWCNLLHTFTITTHDRHRMDSPLATCDQQTSGTQRSSVGRSNHRR